MFKEGFHFNKQKEVISKYKALSVTCELCSILNGFNPFNFL